MKKWINLIEGSSVHQETVKKVHEITKNYNNILICLDSNHTHEHVLKELNLYSPLIEIGGYCCVFDTIIEDMPKQMFNGRPWGPGNNPKTAVWEFLEKNKHCEIIAIAEKNKDLLNKVANKYKIPIIEDAAEALGSTYKGKKCGTFGAYSILSFNGNKIITTSGGGALVTNKKEVKDKAVFLATQARDKSVAYLHSHIGYNYRMSNVLAGIGRGQMEVLDERVTARRANFEFYRTNLAELKEIEFLMERPNEPEYKKYLEIRKRNLHKMREIPVCKFNG